MKLFENGVGRPSNETIKKRKKIYVIIAISVVLLIAGLITGGYFILKANSTIDIEGQELNASNGNFHCIINNAYGNSKKIKELKKIYVYGQCQNNNTKLRSVTTYYMDKNNKILSKVPTVAYNFNYRTVNTSKSFTNNWFIRNLSWGNVKAPQYTMKVKICAKDQKGYIVCSAVKTLNFQ